MLRTAASTVVVVFLVVIFFVKPTQHIQAQ